MQAYIALCFIHLSAGNLSRLSQSAKYFLEMAAELGQSPEIAWAHYFIGLTYYEWNELEKASINFSKGIELRYKADFLTSHLNMMAHALTYQSLGALDDAQEVIKKLRLYSLELKTDGYLEDIDSVQARFSLQSGDLLSAQHWMSSITLDEQPEEFTARHNIRRQIQILAHLALAYQALGQTEEALGILEQAIIIAQPGGFIRTFVDLGLQMSGMLRQLVSQGVAIPYVTRILAAFPESDPTNVSLKDDLAQLVYESSKTILVEPLTVRESEILLQLSERQTNNEIADNLTISILTVKKHTGNIYQKLGVNSRSEAVDKAKALGILAT
jgi:ATP/maltotriose-dependent transcriptional regulator MalT